MALPGRPFLSSKIQDGPEGPSYGLPILPEEYALPIAGEVFERGEGAVAVFDVEAGRLVAEGIEIEVAAAAPPSLGLNFRQ